MAGVDISPTDSLQVRIVFRSSPAMTVLKTPPPNKALDGHLLLIAAPWEPSREWKDRVLAAHPGLRIVYRPLQWGETLAVNTLAAHEWKDITVLLTGSWLPPWPEDVPRLQVVQLSSAGANMVVKHPIFTDTDVAFCTANGVHGPQISEWIITTFLAFNHSLPAYLENQRAATWKRLSTQTEDAVGQRVGILGYGSIGRQTARVARALGMEVYAYTLHARNTPESKHDSTFAPPGTGDPKGEFPARWFSGASRADLHAFLSSGLDLLVVATPLTDSTTHLLGAEELALLGRSVDGVKRPGFLSNIARGPIVDTDALIAALDAGVLRGAALDVTDPEPLPDGHPLWHARNVIITPHVSGVSVHYGERVLAILEDNLGRLSEGRPLANLVNRREGY